MTGQKLPPFGKDIENDVHFQLGQLAADLVSEKTKTSGDVHKVLSNFLANNPVGKRIADMDATEAASLRWQAIAGENQDTIEWLPLKAVEAFVKQVNARAEAEILKTHNIAGAHHRAMEVELALMHAAAALGSTRVFRNYSNPKHFPPPPPPEEAPSPAPLREAQPQGALTLSSLSAQLALPENRKGMECYIKFDKDGQVAEVNIMPPSKA